MGLFGNSLDKWLKSASDEELDAGYEEKRQEWIKTGFNGNGERSPEMEKINKEINKRSAEKWKNNPNRDPNFHWSDKGRWGDD